MRFAFRTATRSKVTFRYGRSAVWFDTFGIGEDNGQPLTFDYKPPHQLNPAPSKPHTARISA